MPPNEDLFAGYEHVDDMPFDDASVFRHEEYDDATNIPSPTLVQGTNESEVTTPESPVTTSRNPNDILMEDPSPEGATNPDPEEIKDEGYPAAPEPIRSTEELTLPNGSRADPRYFYINLQNGDIYEGKDYSFSLGGDEGYRYLQTERNIYAARQNLETTVTLSGIPVSIGGMREPTKLEKEVEEKIISVGKSTYVGVPKTLSIFNRWQRGVRNSDELRGVDTWVRRASAGTAGFFLTKSLGALASVKGALLGGGAFALYPLSLGAGLAGSVMSLPILRWGWAKSRHGKRVKNEFERSVLESTYGPDSTQSPKAALRKMEASIQHDLKKDDDTYLLDTDAEKGLLLSLNKSGIMDYADVPYLHNQMAYIQHTYAKLHKLCEIAHRHTERKKLLAESSDLREHPVASTVYETRGELKARLQASASAYSLSTAPDKTAQQKLDDLRPLSTKEEIFLSELSDKEIETLSSHYANGSGQEKFLEHNRQACVAYGRALSNQKRRSRESQYRWSGTASAIGYSVLASNPLGWAAAPLFYGSRWTYCKIAERKQKLEFDNKGTLLGGILSPKTYKGAGKKLMTRVKTIKKRDQLSEGAKEWEKFMPMPDEVENRTFKTVEALATAAVAPVMQGLTEATDLPTKPTGKDADQLKREADLRETDYRDAQKNVSEFNTDLRRNKRELDKARSDHMAQQGIVDDPKKSKLEKGKAETQLVLLGTSISRLESEKDQLHGKNGEPGDIKDAKVALAAAREAYESGGITNEDDKKNKIWTAEQLAESPDVQSMFAVLSHEWLEDRKRSYGWLGAIGAGAGKGALAGVKWTGAKVGGVAMSGASAFAVAGGATYAALSLLPSAGIPALSTIATPFSAAPWIVSSSIGAIFGIGAIFRSFKK